MHEHISHAVPDNPLLPLSTVELLGTRFHNISLDEFLDEIDRLIARRVPSFVVTPNIDHVVRLSHDAVFREAYTHAQIAVCDSKPLLWAARLLGVRFKQKLSGSDLVHWVSAHAAKKGYRVFLLGAGPGVGEEAGHILKDRYPGLAIVGTYSPPFRFDDDPEEIAITLDRLRKAEADLCFVALGCPRQEIWMSRHVGESGVPVMFGIGAGLDFVTGRFKRAPKWMQQCGLEWFWRMCSDPKRLAKRYLIDDSRFFVMVAREWIRRRRRQRTSTD